MYIYIEWLYCNSRAMFSTPFGIPSTLKIHVSNWMAFHAIGVFLSGGR